MNELWDDKPEPKDRFYWMARASMSRELMLQRFAGE